MLLLSDFGKLLQFFYLPTPVDKNKYLQIP